MALLIGATLSACNTLTSINSKPISDEVQFSRYDSDSKMRYNVYNNATQLKVILSTNDKASQAKILKGGLTLFFNDQGKKKESTFVTFPVESPLQTPDSEKDIRQSGPPNMKNLIRQIPNTKIYSFKGVNQRLAIHEGDIKIQIYSEGEELFYELLIPLERVSDLPKSEMLEIAVGIKSGTLDMPEGRGNPPEGMQGGGGPPGGGSMNGGSGRPPGGGGGPPSGGDRPDMQSMSSPIEFWFKAVLGSSAG